MVMCYFFLFLTRQRWCWTFPCRPSPYMYVCLYISEQDKKINTFPSKFMCTWCFLYFEVPNPPVSTPHLSPFVTWITGEVICFCGFVDHLCPLVIFHFCFRAKIRKCSFKRRRFLLKLHPEIFVSYRCHVMFCLIHSVISLENAHHCLNQLNAN